MPDIHFECPRCGQPIDAPDELVNQSIECPDCGETINIPPLNQTVEASAPVSVENVPDDIIGAIPEPPVGPESPSNDSPPGFNAPMKPFAFGSGAATPASVPLSDKLPDMESSDVATVLTFFAVLEFIGAVIGGFIVGVGDDSNGNPELGWIIFICGVLSGFILLGFARVIEFSLQSSQRLQRIEILIQRRQRDEQLKEIKELDSDIKQLQEELSKRRQENEPANAVPESGVADRAPTSEH